MMFTTIWHAQPPSDFFHTAHLTTSMAAAEVCYSSGISAGVRNADGCPCCLVKGGVQLPSSSTCHPRGAEDYNPTVHHNSQSPCRCHHPCQFYNSNPLYSCLLTSYHSYRYCCRQNHHNHPSPHQQPHEHGNSKEEKGNTDTAMGNDKLSGGGQGVAEHFINNPLTPSTSKESPQTSRRSTTKACSKRLQQPLASKAKQRQTTSPPPAPRTKVPCEEKEQLPLQRRCEQIALELAEMAEEFGREVRWKLRGDEEEESGFALLANLTAHFLTSWLLPRGRDWVAEWLVRII